MRLYKMNKTATKISLLGCGWLGLPLAKKLIQQGNFVNGSTTSESKLPVLEKAGINSFLVVLDATTISNSITSFLADSTVLIIDIPPKLQRSKTAVSVPIENYFVAKIKNLISFIEKSNIKKVLFISSTSVYGDQNEYITEETLPNPATESGKELYLAEELLQKNKNFETTILRFGGLIGEDRHPIKHLAGKENLDNPDVPVNLIHQDDCIMLISEIIRQSKWKEVFNAVAPFHPSRSIYYRQKAKELNLISPKFNHNNTSPKKLILSDKIETVLNYQFDLTKY